MTKLLEVQGISKSFGANSVLGLFGSGQSSDVALTLNNTHSRITFDLWQIVSWENESFRVSIDGTLLFTSPGLTGGTSSLMASPYSGSTTINGKTVGFVVAGAGNAAQVAGGSALDQRFTVSIDLSQKLRLQHQPPGELQP